MGKIVQLTRTTVFSALLIMLAACGQSTDPQRFHGAVQSIKNPGLIVTGLSDSQKEELLLSHPSAKYRVLSSTLSIYEITGVSKEDIKEISSEALIEANEIIEFKAKKDAAEARVTQKLNTLSSTPRSFFSGCTQTPFLEVPKPEILPITENDTEQLQIGDTIQAVSPELNKADVQLAWYVMPPLGSGQEHFFTQEQSVEIEVTMAGIYNIALLYKRNEICNFEMFTLSPTLNEALSEIVTAPESRPESFYHLDVINQQDALALINPIQEVVVAVCDSGVNYNHPALRESIWINEEEIMDGLDNDGNGYVDDVYGYDFLFGDNMPMDDDGHGTHVAGLISGYQMGVAHGLTKIIPLKVGNGDGMDIGSLIECISYATQKNANIINLSIGGNRPNRIVEMVIEHANEKGILVVAAAGNGDSRGVGVNNDLSPLYPASYGATNILSVASIEENGDLTSYSNFGAQTVDIAAPGGYKTFDEQNERQLLSAYIPNPEGVYLQPLSGTSMAAPVTAGAAAILLAEYPEIQPALTIEYLKGTGYVSDALIGKLNSAAVLDIHAAVMSRKLLF